MAALLMTPSASDSEGVHVSDGLTRAAKSVPTLPLTSEFSDCASTARMSAKTVRTSATAAKTAGFFKEFADVLHARMDSLEARIERQLEAIRESHSNITNELVVMRESQSIISEDMSSTMLAQAHDAKELSHLCAISERHGLAHQYHITAVQSLETAIRSLDTSVEEITNKAAATDAEVKACKRAGSTLDEQVSLLVDHSNAKERSRRNTSSVGSELDTEHSGRVVQTLTVPEVLRSNLSTRAGTVVSSSSSSSGDLTSSTESVSERFAAIESRIVAAESNCDALRGHCLSTMSRMHGLDQRISTSSAEHTAELANLKVSQSVLREDVEGRHGALVDQLEVNIIGLTSKINLAVAGLEHVLRSGLLSTRWIGQPANTAVKRDSRGGRLSAGSVCVSLTGRLSAGSGIKAPEHFDDFDSEVASQAERCEVAHNDGPHVNMVQPADLELGQWLMWPAPFLENSMSWR